MKAVKGWKCFDAEMKCRGMQFEVGKTYEHDGKVELCKSGFHFHEIGAHIHNYYSADSRVCEIVAHGVVTGDDKSAASRIEVVRELTYFQIMQIKYGYGDGYGNGYGDGYGDGYGYGYGYGNGYGYGYGDGYGYGNGNGYGYGYGYGDGDGYGYGYGNGYGDGNGYGYGYGNGVNISFFMGFISERIAA